MNTHAYQALIHTDIDVSWIRRITEALGDIRVQQACISQYVPNILRAVADTNPPEGWEFWDMSAKHYVDSTLRAFGFEMYVFYGTEPYLRPVDYERLTSLRSRITMVGITYEQIAQYLKIDISYVQPVIYGLTRHLGVCERLAQLVKETRDE